MGEEYTSEAGAGPGGPPSQQVSPDTQAVGDSAQHESPGAAEVAPNEPGDGETVCRAEFNKVVGQRQAAKEKVRQLTAELEQLSARLRAAPGQEELDAFQEWKRLAQAGGSTVLATGDDATGGRPASAGSPRNCRTPSGPRRARPLATGTSRWTWSTCWTRCLSRRVAWRLPSC